jgi:hypothetical protein
MHNLRHIAVDELSVTHPILLRRYFQIFIIIITCIQNWIMNSVQVFQSLAESNKRLHKNQEEKIKYYGYVQRCQ